MEKLKKATFNANKILVEGLSQLPYFNNINLNKNIKSLKRILTSNFLPANQLLVYSSSNNSLVLDETKINYNNISDEILEMLIIHEYIHMASTNLEKQIIGFSSPSLPITYNEALTQWLTLKIYYKDKLEEALEKNFLYPESVKCIHKLIKEIGEEIVFNHFFETDVMKNINEIPHDKKDAWINLILDLSCSEEELLSKDSMNELEQSINETNDKVTK